MGYPQKYGLQLYLIAPKGFKNGYGQNIVQGDNNCNKHSGNGDIIMTINIGCHRNTYDNKITSVNRMNHGPTPLIISDEITNNNAGYCYGSKNSYQGKKQQLRLKGNTEICLVHIFKQEAEKENLKHQLVHMGDFILGKQLHFFCQHSHTYKNGYRKDCLQRYYKITVH